MSPNVRTMQQDTETVHTVRASVTGADPLTLGTRRFTPQWITVVYAWRSHLAQIGWQITEINICGEWVAGEFTAYSPTRYASLRMYRGIAPQWAETFAEVAMPPEPKPT